ncbi:MAG: histidine ammonia-lyase [Bacteroidota bacterium]|nr:histidine ammonia-lyase [Bacteroidota bacterium]
MKSTLELGHRNLNIFDLQGVLRGSTELRIGGQARERVIECRAYLDRKMAASEDPIYGINTGFGSLCDVKISVEQLEKLQENLVMSHACGMGEEVPSEVVRLMLALKVQSLSLGHSAVQEKTIDLLLAMYNLDILPIVYQQGSLGASGDLAPLAHLSLPLLGKGDVYLKGKRMSTARAFEKTGLEPISLRSKEGLALLNGTQFMTAYAVWALLQSTKLNYLADLIGATSLDAFDGRIEPFFAQIHEVRGQSGQIDTAANIREFLQGSQLIQRAKEHVQDPYSFRCIPQVHGASRDAIRYVRSIVEREMNAVTDNPTVFPEDDLIISGGNFHGQPLAISMDLLAIALSELGNISERRVYQMVNGKRGLPAFLVAEPGLNSGFMIPQYTAASIVSQNKQLCTPASVDSIESSNGQEDHVSMGANAATKLYRVVENLERILGIELYTASQALGFRKDNTSPFIEEFILAFRNEVPFVEVDTIHHEHMVDSAAFLRHLEVDAELL